MSKICQPCATEVYAGETSTDVANSVTLSGYAALIQWRGASTGTFTDDTGAVATVVIYNNQAAIGTSDEFDLASEVDVVVDSFAGTIGNTIVDITNGFFKVRRGLDS